MENVKSGTLNRVILKELSSVLESKTKLKWEELCSNILFRESNVRIVENKLEGFMIFDQIINRIIESSNDLDILLIIATLQSLDIGIKYVLSKANLKQIEYLFTIFLKSKDGDTWVYEVDFSNINDLRRSSNTFRENKENPNITQNGLLDYRNIVSGNEFLNYHMHSFDESRTRFKGDVNKDLELTRRSLTRERLSIVTNLPSQLPSQS
jgi:hypothetical protein